MLFKKHLLDLCPKSCAVESKALFLDLSISMLAGGSISRFKSGLMQRPSN